MSRSSMQENGITEGVIWKQLLYFFFPILFGTFFQQLYNTADAIIVGQFVGKEALAAVGGSTGTIIMLLVNLFVGVSSGATVVIAQHYGARRLEEVSNAVHTSMALAVTAGAAIMVLGLLLSPWALQAMSTPEDIMPYALTYIRIYFVGTIASFIYNIGSGILRAVGDTRRPLYFLIISCLVNIVLDLVLVLGFKMGVAGAGLATIFSQVVSAVLVLRTLLRADWPLRVERKQIQFHKQQVQEILRIGVPAGIQSDMYTISNLIIQTCINGFGTNTVAAWTAFGKVDGFYWMIIAAFGVSITTFVGQNFGAQKYKRVRKSVRTCLLMALGTTVFMSVVFVFGMQYMLRLFTNDPAVLELGQVMTQYMCPFYFTYICIEVLSGAIRGTGVSLPPTIITCMGVCVLRVVWIMVLVPLRPELSTVLISYPLSWAMTSLIFIGYYLHGGWMRKRIMQLGLQPE